MNDSLLPSLRYDIAEAARILRMSRASLYKRISEGEISIHKDGRRSYVGVAELERYARSKETHATPPDSHAA